MKSLLKLLVYSASVSLAGGTSFAQDTHDRMMAQREQAMRNYEYMQQGQEQTYSSPDPFGQMLGDLFEDYLRRQLATAAPVPPLGNGGDLARISAVTVQDTIRIVTKAMQNRGCRLERRPGIEAEFEGEVRALFEAQTGVAIPSAGPVYDAFDGLMNSAAAEMSRNGQIQFTAAEVTMKNCYASGSRVVPKIETLPRLVGFSIPAGECFLIIAARSTMAEAREFANASHDGVRYSQDNIRFFKSANGWFAISLGRVRANESKEVIATATAKGVIPADSYCTRGDKFLGEVEK